MALETDFTKIPYPQEKEDPFYESFKSMIVAVDTKIYGLLSSAGNIVIPPNNMVWDASQSLLTWDSDFIVPILSTNRKLFVRFGPDQVTRTAIINDGEKLIIVAHLTSNEDVVANLQIVNNEVPWQDGLFILGMRSGNGLYMNIGTKI